MQLGTAFLGCPEATVSTLHRQALLAGSDESVRVTRAFTGRPARALANSYVLEIADAETDALDVPLQRGLSAPLAQAAAERGSSEFAAMWAGQGRP